VQQDSEIPRQQAPDTARCVPDPFILLGVGSGDETIAQAVRVYKVCRSADLACMWHYCLGLGYTIMLTVTAAGLACKNYLQHLG
jgi:type IV secretory pathway TrbL component